MYLTTSLNKNDYSYPENWHDSKMIDERESQLEDFH